MGNVSLAHALITAIKDVGHSYLQLTQLIVVKCTMPSEKRSEAEINRLKINNTELAEIKNTLGIAKSNLSGKHLRKQIYEKGPIQFAAMLVGEPKTTLHGPHCYKPVRTVYRRGHLAENDPLPTNNSLRNVNNSFSIRKVSCFKEKQSSKTFQGEMVFLSFPWQPIMIFS